MFGCPGIGWLDYKSSCYMIIQRSIDWKGALQYCRNKGADLASINTKDENDFVYSQLPKGKCLFVLLLNKLHLYQNELYSLSIVISYKIKELVFLILIYI